MWVRFVVTERDRLDRTQLGRTGRLAHDRGNGGLARGERGDQSKHGAVLQIALYVAAVCTYTN